MSFDLRRRRRPGAIGNSFAPLEEIPFEGKGICCVQHDMDVANGSGATVRADLNNALDALATLSSGATEPGTTQAYQLWADTTANLLKQRNAANTAWITLWSLPADIARLSAEDQALTGGVIVTSKSLGTITTGTVTPDPGDRPMQHYTNGGAHTLAPSANAGSVLVDITNDASAGAITTSGFTFVTGDAFTTTNGQKFRCHISIGNGGSLLQVQALQ